MTYEQIVEGLLLTEEDREAVYKEFHCCNETTGECFGPSEIEYCKAQLAKILSYPIKGKTVGELIKGEIKGG